MASTDTNLTTQTKPPKYKTPLPISTAANDGFVVLEIGPEKLRYHLHRALLTHHSEYFNNALNGPWKESEEKFVTLEDVDTVAVDIFVHWLYTQQIPDHWNTSQMIRRLTPDPEDDDPVITGYTKALAFGDRFVVPIFRQAVHNCLVDTLLHDPTHDKVAHRSLTFFTATEYALANLPSDHSIVDLFLDIHCRYWNVSDEGGDNGGEYSEESGIAEMLKSGLSHILLVRMVARYSSRAVNACRDWWKTKLKRCDYHEHLDDQERKDCIRKSHRASQAG